MRCLCRVQAVFVLTILAEIQNLLFRLIRFLRVSVILKKKVYLDNYIEFHIQCNHLLAQNVLLHKMSHVRQDLFINIFHP